MLLGLALADADHAAVVGRGLFVLQVFDQHVDELPDLRRLFAFVPFVERDRAFALEADIDHHHAVVDAENAAFDDLVDVEIAAAAFGRGQAGFFKAGDGRLKHRLDIGVVFESADQCAINHVRDSTLRRIRQPDVDDRVNRRVHAAQLCEADEG